MLCSSFLATFVAQLGLLGVAGNISGSSMEALTVIMTSWILAHRESGALHCSVQHSVDNS